MGQKRDGEWRLVRLRRGRGRQSLARVRVTPSPGGATVTATFRQHVLSICLAVFFVLIAIASAFTESWPIVPFFLVFDAVWIITSVRDLRESESQIRRVL